MSQLSVCYQLLQSLDSVLQDYLAEPDKLYDIVFKYITPTLISENTKVPGATATFFLETLRKIEANNTLEASTAFGSCLMEYACYAGCTDLAEVFSSPDIIRLFVPLSVQWQNEALDKCLFFYTEACEEPLVQTIKGMGIFDEHLDIFILAQDKIDTSAPMKKIISQLSTVGYLADTMYPTFNTTSITKIWMIYSQQFARFVEAAKNDPTLWTSTFEDIAYRPFSFLSRIDNSTPTNYGPILVEFLKTNIFTEYISLTDKYLSSPEREERLDFLMLYPIKILMKRLSLGDFKDLLVNAEVSKYPFIRHGIVDVINDASSLTPGQKADLLSLLQ